LPSLLLWMRQSGRKRPLTLLAESNSLNSIARLLDLGYPGSFTPQKCFALDLQPLVPALDQHLGGVRLSIAATDHSVDNFALRIDDQGIACAFSGDGRPNESTRELFADLDLLTHECAFLTRSSPNHANAADVEQLVKAASPRRLAVVHCSAGERRHIEAQLSAALGDRVVFPRPGTRIRISRAKQA
jgi:ribonuclease BN (tRNA processing enzyme)